MGFNLEKSKDGYFILRVDKDNKSVYIGSKYCEKREVEKFIKDINPTIDKNYIVIGVGTGEHIRELVKHLGTTNRIMVIEPDIDLYRFVKENGIVNDIINDDRIKLVFNKDEINKYFEENVSGFNVESYVVKSYTAYEKIFKEEINELYNCIKEHVVSAITERNTQLYFAKTWTKGFFENLKYMKNVSTIGILKNKYKNVPAIIVSAGPSLKKNINQLIDFNNGLILSGGRTLRTLKEFNISPHGLVVVDPGEISYNLVSDYIDKIDTPLFFYEGTNERIIKEHKGKKIMCSDHPFINKILGDNNETINKGGSVAHSMTFLAAYMGCSPIIFIGQDLAYTNNELHADITKNKGQDYTAKNFAKKDDFVIKDIYGNDILTSKLFNTFRLELEKIIKEFPHIKFVNATEGGASINGTEVMTLKDAILQIEDIDFESVEGCLEDKDYSKVIIKELQSLLKSVDVVKVNCSNGIKYLEKLKIAYKINDNSQAIYLNKKLDKIEKVISSNMENLSALSNAIYKEIYVINNSEKFKVLPEDSENLKLIKRIDMNKSIYEKIILVINNNIELIEDTLIEIKKGNE